MEYKKERHKVTRSQEKIIGLVYVVTIFFLTTALCGYILFFSTNNYQTLKGKKAILEQIHRVRVFEKEQAEQMAKLELINTKITQFDPSLKAIYEKQEITLLLGEVRHVYLQHKWDNRYKIFEQMAVFYELQLLDKDRLWNIQQNIEKFKSDLERCRANTENRRNNLQ